jgi:hypothetical protein
MMLSRRLQASRPLMLWIAHPRTDREGFHPITGERHEQRAQSIGRGARIKPFAIRGRVDYDEHTSVVQGAHEFVGLGRQDGTRLD